MDLCFDSSFSSNFGVLLSRMLSGTMTRRRSSENSKHCRLSLFVSFHVEPLVAHHFFGAEVDGRKVMGHPERCVKT